MSEKNEKLLGLLEDAKKLAVEIQTANKTQNLDVHYIGEAMNVTKMRIAYLKNKPAPAARTAPKKPTAAEKAEEQKRLAAEAQAKADEEELARMEAEEKRLAEESQKENSETETK